MTTSLYDRKRVPRKSAAPFQPQYISLYCQSTGKLERACFWRGPWYRCEGCWKMVKGCW